MNSRYGGRSVPEDSSLVLFQSAGEGSGCRTAAVRMPLRQAPASMRRTGTGRQRDRACLWSGLCDDEWCVPLPVETEAARVRICTPMQSSDPATDAHRVCSAQPRSKANRRQQLVSRRQHREPLHPPTPSKFRSLRFVPFANPRNESRQGDPGADLRADVDRCMKSDHYRLKTVPGSSDNWTRPTWTEGRNRLGEFHGCVDPKALQAK
jgi:hypothetical protein